jgi:hypothetical protein
MTTFSRIAALAACLTLLLAAAGGSPIMAAATAHLTISQTELAATGPAQRVWVKDGGNLADFEALLREQFPSHAPCMRQSSFSFISTKPDGACPAHATPYVYIFRASAKSTFRLYGKRITIRHFPRGPNGTIAAVVRGRLVACDRTGNFAIGLSESAGASNPINPPVPACLFQASSIRGVPAPAWPHRAYALTAQGALAWNLVALRGGDCFSQADPRTEWNLVAGQEPGCAYYSTAVEFATPDRRSAFRRGSYYDPGTRIGDGAGDLPVLQNGRVIICDNGPTRYLFGPGPERYTQHHRTYRYPAPFHAVCARPHIVRGHTPNLVAALSSRGSAHILVRRRLSVFGWRYLCGGPPSRANADRFTVVARMGNHRVGKFVSKGPDGERQGEPSWFVFGHITRFTISPRPSRAAPHACKWQFWALGFDYAGPKW